MHLAAAVGHADIVSYLVGKGLSVHAINRAGKTPLHIASCFGHYNAVEVLVNNGADFKAGCMIYKLGICEDKDVSPLMLSALKNDLDLVNYFINLGADVNAKSWRGFTALHFACHTGCLIVVNTLLEHHSDVNATTVVNSTPLHYAVSRNTIEVVEQLLKVHDIDINAKNSDRFTPLDLAVQFGFVDIVKLLIENNADINATPNIRCMTLNMSSTRNHQEIMQILSRARKMNKPNNIDNDNPDVIMFKSINANNITNLENAIKNGANVNASSKKYNSPIIFASWKGYYKIIQILIKYNADVNITGKNNCTALHYAAKYNHIDIVHYLLQNGAKYNVSTKENKKPSDYACRGSKVSMLFQLIDKLFSQVNNGKNDVVNELLKIKKKDINDFNCIMKTCNVEGRTLVQLNGELLNKHGDISKSFAQLLI